MFKPLLSCSIIALCVIGCTPQLPEPEAAVEAEARVGPQDPPMPPVIDWRLGDHTQVYRTTSSKITQALDLTNHGNDIVACFGSWHSGAGWGSYCRSIFGGATDAGAGGHETAGVGVARGPAGLLVAYEPDLNRNSGGIGLFGSGLVYQDANHYWQAVSVDPRPGRLAIAAAARNTPGDLTVDVFAGRSNGGGAWQQIGSAGAGIALRQSFVSPYHLIFRSAYYSGGTPGLIRVTAGSEPSNAVVAEKSYAGLPSCAQGISTAELVPFVGLVAGTYSGTLPWRGGSCGHVGIITRSSLDGAGAANTHSWQRIRTGGQYAADVTDIVPIGASGMFAVASNFPARVQLFDRDLTVVDERLFGSFRHAGGLAVRGPPTNRKLYFSVAKGPNQAADARVYAIDLVPDAPTVTPQITRLYERPDPIHHDETLNVVIEGTDFGATGTIEIVVDGEVTPITANTTGVSMTWTNTRVEAVVSTLHTSQYPYGDFHWAARVLTPDGKRSNTVASTFRVCPRPSVFAVVSNPRPANRRSALTVSTLGGGFGPAATLEVLVDGRIERFTTSSPGVDLLWAEGRIDLVIPQSYMATYALGTVTFGVRVLDSCGARSNTKPGSFTVVP